MFGAVLGMSDQSSLPGWVDNVNNGGVAFMAGVGRGVFRTIGARQDLIADMVPCDQLASLLIAAAWAAYKERYTISLVIKALKRKIKKRKLRK